MKVGNATFQNEAKEEESSRIPIQLAKERRASRKTEAPVHKYVIVGAVYQ